MNRKRNWVDIEWIFVPEGTLRDIYVQNITWKEWEKVLSCLNKEYQLKYAGGESSIDIEYVHKLMTDKSGEMEVEMVQIKVGNLNINCHFFLIEEIEFDIDPRELQSIEDFISLEHFMIRMSEVTEKQIILTDENDANFPLFKVDVSNNINTLLTKDDVLNFNQKVISSFCKMKYNSNEFKQALLESASKPHKASTKENNIW